MSKLYFRMRMINTYVRFYFVTHHGTFWCINILGSKIWMVLFYITSICTPKITSATSSWVGSIEFILNLQILYFLVHKHCSSHRLRLVINYCHYDVWCVVKKIASEFIISSLVMGKGRTMKIRIRGMIIVLGREEIAFYF